MTAKIGFVGDPHVGRMGTLVGTERGLVLHARALRQQFDEARQDGATHAIVLGDLFDTPHPNQNQLILVLKALHDARDMRIVVMPGNHDYESIEHNSLKLLLRLPEAGALRHVRFILNPQAIDFAGLRLWVHPWRAKFPNQRVDVDLVVMHSPLVGAKTDSGYVVLPGKGTEPTQFNEAFGEVPIVGGDIHTPQRLGRFVYAGTIAQMSFGEQPDKRVLSIDAQTLKISSRKIRPPWLLETVEYSAENPPECGAPGTFYKLILGEEAPSPRWLIEHPRIKKVDPGKRKARTESTVVQISGIGSDESDTDAMRRWLREYSTLDALGRARALKEHEKLSK